LFFEDYFGAVTTPSSIQVGFDEHMVWVRVAGRGSFQNSTPLKEFVKEMLARGYRRFTVDLQECPVMDSTFMGTLAGIALKLQTGDGIVRVIRLNERNHSLLANLGLDQLLQLEPLGAPGVESSDASLPEGAIQDLQVGQEDKASQARTMLEAHEAVVHANPLNEAKFKDVLDFLRQDVSKRL
jgi:anti-sigma B factor antagonist